MGRGRWLAIAAVLAVSAAATAFWFLALGPIREHRHWSDRVRADRDSLADKRPVDVPPGQWELMVGWTIILHANSAASRQWVDRGETWPFVEELERRGSGHVLLAAEGTAAKAALDALIPTRHDTEEQTRPPE